MLYPTNCRTLYTRYRGKKKKKEDLRTKKNRQLKGPYLCSNQTFAPSLALVFVLYIDFAVTWRGKQTVKTVVAVAVAAAAL